MLITSILIIIAILVIDIAVITIAFKLLKGGCFLALIILGCITLSIVVLFIFFSAGILFLLV